MQITPDDSFSYDYTNVDNDMDYQISVTSRSVSTSPKEASAGYIV